MIYSMTGFGKAETGFDEAIYSVEIKSLNSKYFDLQVRLPQELRAKEMELRKWLEKKLLRGKILFQISRKNLPANLAPSIHLDLIKRYKTELLKTFNSLEDNYLIPALLRNPDVWIREKDEDAEKIYKAVFPAVEQAVEELIAFRKQEGEEIEKDLMEKRRVIEEKLNEVKKLDPGRIEKIRSRLEEEIKRLKERVDTNRFEQELIYYLDKLDINEEISRLKNHLKYFDEIILSPTISKGKKLNFIAQEMGREINTTGSKANDSRIQRLVVEMKDALEKIKEQTANVL